MKVINLKNFLPIIAVSAVSLLVFLTSANNAFATEEDSQLGSISVCKVIANAAGNVIDGSTLPATTFEISGINPAQNSGPAPVGQIGTSTFNTPLVFNSDLLFGDKTLDSECTTYAELELGDYYYGQELITPGSGWQTPLYNDQFTLQVGNLSDFFAYDNTWFDGDPTNDAGRNTNADGHIVLNSERPNRTLIVLNRREPTTTTTSTTTTSTGGGNPPSCDPVNKPQKVDQVWVSDVQNTSLVVNWANKGDATGYHINYGTDPGNLTWGVVVGNVSSYKLDNLPAGATIYVKVYALKDICVSDGSDTVQSARAQVLGARTPSVLAATGDFKTDLIAGAGFALISLGLWRLKKNLQAKKG